MQIRRLAYYAAQGQSIRARIKRKGICPRGAPLWTTAEDNAIRRFYPDYEAAARILTRRTLSAIRKRAFRLKIVRKSYRWTAAEVIRLKRIYPTGPREEILAAFPGADWQQITNMRKRLKIYRKRRPLKAIGCPITDEIRIRARELNLSMKDLDTMIGAGSYFGHPFRRQSLNRRAIYRAIEALDGEVRLVWKW